MHGSTNTAAKLYCRYNTSVCTCESGASTRRTPARHGLTAARHGLHTQQSTPPRKQNATAQANPTTNNCLAATYSTHTQHRLKLRRISLQDQHAICSAHTLHVAGCLYVTVHAVPAKPHLRNNTCCILPALYNCATADLTCATLLLLLLLCYCPNDRRNYARANDFCTRHSLCSSGSFMCNLYLTVPGP
jgi:hypothetical protein